jgi:cytochrome c oxidase cbb3-type subunit 1
MVILFGSWAGVPNSAPVPAWMPALSTIGSVLMLIPVLAVVLNVYHTLGGNLSRLNAHPALPFIFFGAVGFIVAGLMMVAGALLDPNQLLQLTWFRTAQREMAFYGFFIMIIFGAVYRILPQLTATSLPWPKLVRIHFWLAVCGVVLVVLPLGGAGLVQVIGLANPSVAPVALTTNTLPFLRVSTIGILLLAVGHVLFFVNLAGLVVSFYRAKAAAAYAVMTADLFKTAGAKP